MQPTTYQKPEIRDANDNIIQQGAFGKNTALANATNDGWIDYVANDLEFLYDLAKDEVVPVPSLPASGQTNKTYLLTTTGVSYRWSGTEWVAVSSSEAVGRAESAALLAEQWATKTDGTVDGTEYSAKYYAEQAGQSADDAQDVADDMATHLVQIDKNTGGVAKNSKRISNIEKLLQGNLYDYDTDDDVAYVKDVPSGALPYAGVEKLGGKTLVWNQLAELIGNSGVSQDITWTKNDNGTYSAVGTSTGSTYRDVTSRLTSLAGHKILIKGCPANDGTNKYMIFDGYSNGATSGDYGYGKIYTAGANVQIRCFVASDATVDIVFTPQVFDLTLMFGSGSEPSTVAEFEAMFPAQYYPYNAGTLLSAGVTEVESVGKNLCDGSAVLGTINTGLAYVVANTAITSPYTIPTNYHGVMFHANVEAGKTYVISSDITAGTNVLWYWAVYNNMTEATNRSNMLEYGNTAYSFTPTKSGVCVFMHHYSAKVSVSWTKVQLEVGSTATAYSPYVEATMPIPAEVKALDGYGWSAGSVSNYIDFDRKVFVKRVGAVDLGDMSWTKSSSENHELFFCSVNDIKEASATTVKGNIVCPAYMSGTYGNVYNHTYDKIIGVSNTSHRVAVYDTNTLSLTATQFKSAMSGISLYYEMETPVETDISQYLTDNLVEVGAGGTLTFENSNGDDYHIPVPSEVTYMIDLQSAIGE